MMNDDMLRNIEYLREKADVSYEEAATLLERFDGNVMRVLVELERQGRVFPQGQAAGQQQDAPKAEQPKQQQAKNETREKAENIINKAFEHHIVIEKKKDGKKETVANLSAPYVAGAAILAPHVAAASIALMFVCGYKVKWKREKTDTQIPEDVETFVDKTVSNIKKTASSFVDVDGKKHDDDDDEGGEITVD